MCEEVGVCVCVFFPLKKERKSPIVRRAMLSSRWPKKRGKKCCIFHLFSFFLFPFSFFLFSFLFFSFPLPPSRLLLPVACPKMAQFELGKYDSTAR